MKRKREPERRPYYLAIARLQRGRKPLDDELIEILMSLNPDRETRKRRFGVWLAQRSPAWRRVL
jgi:hypothetical protein